MCLGFTGSEISALFRALVKQKKPLLKAFDLVTVLSCDFLKSESEPFIPYFLEPDSCWHVRIQLCCPWAQVL